MIDAPPYVSGHVTRYVTGASEGALIRDLCEIWRLVPRFGVGSDFAWVLKVVWSDDIKIFQN